MSLFVYCNATFTIASWIVLIFFVLFCFFAHPCFPYKTCDRPRSPGAFPSESPHSFFCQRALMNPSLLFAFFQFAQVIKVRSRHRGEGRGGDNECSTTCRDPTEEEKTAGGAKKKKEMICSRASQMSMAACAFLLNND